MAGQMVTFASNGGTADGYLALPKSGAGPGVVVIQEYWGLVPHIKDLADRFAAEGFVALAPDLYHGDAATHPDEAARMMMALNMAQTEKDLRGAVALLKSRTGGRKLGVIGFCMGGSLALVAATKNPDVAACVTCYGPHRGGVPDYSKLNGPVLGIWGGKDAHIPMAAINEIEGAVKAAGRSAEMKVYPDAGHAFINDSRPTVYHKASAEDAWNKAVGFLKTHLA